jgi:hypothetical protein
MDCISIGKERQFNGFNVKEVKPALLLLNSTITDILNSQWVYPAVMNSKMYEKPLRALTPSVATSFLILLALLSIVTFSSLIPQQEAQNLLNNERNF